MVVSNDALSARGIDDAAVLQSMSIAAAFEPADERISASIAERERTSVARAALRVIRAKALWMRHAMATRFKAAAGGEFTRAEAYNSAALHSIAIRCAIVVLRHGRLETLYVCGQCEDALGFHCVSFEQVARNAAGIQSPSDSAAILEGDCSIADCAAADSSRQTTECADKRQCVRHDSLQAMWVVPLPRGLVEQMAMRAQPFSEIAIVALKMHDPGDSCDGDDPSLCAFEDPTIEFANGGLEVCISAVAIDRTGDDAYGSEEGAAQPPPLKKSQAHRRVRIAPHEIIASASRYLLDSGGDLLGSVLGCWNKMSEHAGSEPISPTAAAAAPAQPETPISVQKTERS